MQSSRIDWVLWHHDLFDREAPASVQARGRELPAGLYQLWLSTLSESLLEGGTASFSRFQLCWGDPMQRAEIPVQPFENPALLKLRGWIWQNGSPANSLLPTSAILQRLADLHHGLLAARQDTAGWSGEADLLLKRILSAGEPEELADWEGG